MSDLTQIEKLQKEKDQAYWERNQLLLMLTKFLPSKRARHPEEDKEWEDDWRNIIVIEGTVERFGTKIIVGQMTWHIHDSEFENFKHLPADPDFVWDGHSTEAKYVRLKSLGHLII